MTAAEILVVDEDGLRAIERNLAYNASCALLDNDFPIVMSDHPSAWPWIDLRGYSVGDDPEDDDALTYLQARGLIELDPEHPTWIAIREESEATR